MSGVWQARTRWIGNGLAVVWRLYLAGLLVAAGCRYQAPGVPKLPLRVEVENPGHLQVAVVEATKRPLAPGELAAFQRAGSRWQYSVRFTDTAGVGVQFRQIETTVRSLTGVASSRTIPLVSRVEPRGTTPISIDAFLATSDPAEPGDLTGVQELVFLGRDDRGQPVRVVVRVPLE
jgi:hypothetical protein